MNRGQAREAFAPRSGRNPGVPASRRRADDARVRSRERRVGRGRARSCLARAVTVTNVDTNAARSVVTDVQGFYRVPALEPGTYTVRTELSGFQTVENREVRLVGRGRSHAQRRAEGGRGGRGDDGRRPGRSDRAEQDEPDVGATTMRARSSSCRSRRTATSTTCRPAPNVVRAGGQGTSRPTGSARATTTT